MIEPKMKDFYAKALLEKLQGDFKEGQRLCEELKKNEKEKLREQEARKV